MKKLKFLNLFLLFAIIINTAVFSQPVDYKLSQSKKIIIIPTNINSKNDMNVIFSKGILFSLSYILSSTGCEVEFIDPLQTMMRINQTGIKPEELKNNQVAKTMLFQHFNADYIMFSDLREIGSRFTQYWTQFLDIDPQTAFNNVQSTLQDEDKLLKSMRFNFSAELFDVQNKKVWNKSYNLTGDDFFVNLSAVFYDMKNFFKADGSLLSDFNTVNGHTKNFRSAMFIYRAVEIGFNPQTKMKGIDVSVADPKTKFNLIKSELDKALYFSKGSAFPHIILAYTNLMDNNNFEAIRNMKLGTGIEPERLSLKMMLALLEEEFGSKENAWILYNEILSDNKNPAFNRIRTEAALRLGLNLFNQKKYNETIAKSDITLNKIYNPRLHFLKILSLIELKKFNQAENEVKFLNSVLKDDIYVQVIYSDILVSLKHSQQALDILRKVTENFGLIGNSVLHNLNIIEIKKEDVFYRLGEVYIMLDNKNQAENFFKQAIAVSPYSETATKARNRINSILQ